MWGQIKITSLSQQNIYYLVICLVKSSEFELTRQMAPSLTALSALSRADLNCWEDEQLF